MNSEPSPDDRLRARDVLTIVIAGAAMGVLFNAMQLSADPTRGLTWVKGERRVVSLERVSGMAPDSAAAPVAAAAATAAPVAARPDSALKPAAATAGSTKGAPTAGTHATAPSATTPKPAVAPGATTPATTAPAATATSAPAADLPTIPDSRDPIEVGLDTVQKFHAAGAALIVDARSAEEYAEGHIAGAVNLPFDDVFKKPALAKSLDAKGRPIIAYCGGGDCELSKSLAFTLLDAGYKKVLVFTGGLPAWKDAGKPVHTGAQP